MDDENNHTDTDPTHVVYTVERIEEKKNVPESPGSPVRGGYNNVGRAAFKRDSVPGRAGSGRARGPTPRSGASARVYNTIYNNV